MTKTGLKNERPTRHRRASMFIFFLFVILNFGHWNFFDIWDLIFGISISQ